MAAGPDVVKQPTSSHASAAPALGRALRRTLTPGTLVPHLLLTIAAIVSIYPVVWTALTSLKAEREIFSAPWALPKQPSLAAYVNAWNQAHLDIAFRNSLFVTVVSTLLVTIFAAGAAYAFSRAQARWARVLYVFFVVALMIPTDVVFLPLYLELRSFGLINNLGGLIGPYVAAGIPISIFVLTDFMRSVPKELIDSATVDGCSRFGVFWRIVLPLSLPPLLGVAAFQFTIQWNEFLLALIVLRDAELQTLPLAIYAFVGQYTTRYAEVFAVVVMSAIPTVIVFMLLQNQFVKGLTSGALKE